MATNEFNPQRYVTTNDQTTGQAVFDKTISTDLAWRETGCRSGFITNCYMTDTFPVKLSEDADIKRTVEFDANPPGLVIPNGTILRYTTVKPGKTSATYRSISLSWCILVEGSLELKLDSGEKQLVKQGDIVIQRATMHEWHNPGETEARLLIVTQPAEPLEVAGKPLQQDARMPNPPN